MPDGLLVWFDDNGEDIKPHLLVSFFLVYIFIGSGLFAKNFRDDDTISVFGSEGQFPVFYSERYTAILFLLVYSYIFFRALQVQMRHENFLLISFLSVLILLCLSEAQRFFKLIGKNRRAIIISFTIAYDNFIQLKIHIFNS